MMPIVLNNHQYPSVEAAAKEHHMSYNLLKRRIRRYGHNDYHLFRPKQEKGQPKAVILNDEKFDSLKDAADKYHLSTATLRYRIKKFGTNSPKLFVKNLKNHQIKINGKIYKSKADAARQNNIKEPTLLNHLIKYDFDDPKIFDVKYERPAQKIVINGHEYKTIKEAADIHNIKLATFNNRIKRYGHTDPRLIMPTSTYTNRRNDN